MQKTRKGIAKRVKVTGSGKMLRRTPGHRHMLRKQSISEKRRAKQDKTVSCGFRKMFLKGLPCV